MQSKHPSGLHVLNPDQINPEKCLHWGRSPLHIEKIKQLLEYNDIDRIFLPTEDNLMNCRSGKKVSRVVVQRGRQYEIMSLGKYYTTWNWFACGEIDEDMLDMEEYLSDGYEKLDGDDT